MLTRSVVEDIIEFRLPERNIVQHLEELTSDQLDPETIRTFVDVLHDTLDQPSQALGDYIGAIDPSGTGGSGKPHFNTSTTVAFILAAGDMKVAKFGNRGAQSACGSFDLLDVLGIPQVCPAQAVPELLDSIGIAFLFAPQYYRGLAKLAPIRKSLAKRTIFNAIGPLLNPILPNYRVMGVSCPHAQQAIGEYLSQEKHNRRSLIVHSASGLDELEPYAENTVVDAMPGYVASTQLSNMPFTQRDDGVWNPSHVQHADASKSAAARMRQAMASYAFTPEENCKLFKATINGEGPQWLVDLVCLNAAAGFVANCCSSIDACYDMARSLMQSGKVAEKVEECQKAYAKFATR
jgi:anthranilate phosphoribosyltransferase